MANVELNLLEEQLIGYRRQLHQKPELAFEEIETTGSLKRWLDEASVRTVDLPLSTGVLAIIDGKKPGPVIALRSDIDALPIQEQTGLPYSSKVPGKMHACGHDVHMASILGAVLLLKEQEEELEGTVKIIFQPAEENGCGAVKVLQTGVLSDVQAICGMHIMPNLPVGTIGIKSGPLMAGVDHFIIDIEGTETHGAVPEKGTDTIVAAGQIIAALQTVISRNISPLDQALISVTRVQAGNTWNVMPQRAQLEGTVRTFRGEVRNRIEKRMKTIVEDVAQAFGTTGKLDYIRLGPPVVNDSRLADLAESAAQASGLKVINPELTTIGEDFAEYQKKMPGAFFFMGVSGNSDLHHSDLIIDERAIMYGARFFSALAKQLIDKMK